MIGATCRGHPRRGGSDKLSSWAGELSQYRVGRFTPDEARTMLEHWRNDGTMTHDVSP